MPFLIKTPFGPSTNDKKKSMERFGIKEVSFTIDTRAIFDEMRETGIADTLCGSLLAIRLSKEFDDAGLMLSPQTASLANNQQLHLSPTFLNVDIYELRIKFSHILSRITRMGDSPIEFYSCKMTGQNSMTLVFKFYQG